MAEAAPAVESEVRDSRSNLRSILIGAAFLMATSAIGPGFLTQTAVFTGQLRASFGFAILISVLFDLAAQLNIWRVVAVAERRAQDVANTLLPGLGTLLAILVSLGGLAFNIGNIAGAGLGMSAMLGMTVLQGALLSAVIGVALFISREAGRAMDRFAQLLGFLMVALTLYVAVASRPPMGEAALRSVAPTRVDVFAIITIVGGTVGGYITFAGAHRLLDAGVTGRASLRRVSQSATSGILIASLMRVLLFLAALGVVSHGFALDPANPPASVFRLATGEIGYRVFGVVDVVRGDHVGRRIRIYVSELSPVPQRLRRSPLDVDDHRLHRALDSDFRHRWAAGADAGPRRHAQWLHPSDLARRDARRRENAAHRRHIPPSALAHHRGRHRCREHGRDGRLVAGDADSATVQVERQPTHLRGRRERSRHRSHSANGVRHQQGKREPCGSHLGSATASGSSTIANELAGSLILAIGAEVRAMAAAGKPLCNLTVGDFNPKEFAIPRSLLDGVTAALQAGETELSALGRHRAAPAVRSVTITRVV